MNHAIADVLVGDARLDDGGGEGQPQGGNGETHAPTAGGMRGGEGGRVTDGAALAPAVRAE
eukprot:4281268-Pleurochrysis_carterae.AAC.1